MVMWLLGGGGGTSGGGVGTTDLATLRRALGTLIRSRIQVTTSGAGSTTEIVAAKLDDYITRPQLAQQYYAHIKAQGEWRRVTDYSDASFTATVNRAYTNTVGSGTVVDFYRYFNPDELDRALQDAGVECYPYLFDHVVDESLTTAETTWEYTIPSTIVDLRREWGGKVLWEWDTANATHPYRPVNTWRVRTDGLTRTLVIEHETLPTNRTIRLEGIGYVDVPTADDDTINLSEEQVKLLLFKAAEILYRTSPSTGPQDRAFSEAQAQLWERKYMEHRDIWGDSFSPGNLYSAAMADTALEYDLARWADPE